MIGTDLMNKIAAVKVPTATHTGRIGGNNENLAEVLSKGYTGYKQQLNKDALVSALQGGDEKQINSAWANYDPQGYAEHVTNLEADNKKFAQEKELAQMGYDSQMALAKYNKSVTNPTKAIQNYEYLVKQGVEPKKALVMAFNGNSEAVGQSLVDGTLGQKGQDKFSENMGKQYAQDLDEYNNFVSKMPELEAMVGKLNELGKTATYTKAGQLSDYINKEIFQRTGQGARDRAEYMSIVSNSVLPLLRDTFGAAFTEREGNKLEATLGDPNSTPEEKERELNSFIQTKIDQIKGKYRKLQSYKQDDGMLPLPQNSGNVNTSHDTRVRMQAPDGNVYLVEQDEVKNAINLGGRIVR